MGTDGLWLHRLVGYLWHRAHFPANTLRRDTKYYIISIFPRHSFRPAWLVLFRLFSILAKNNNTNPTANTRFFQFLVAIHSVKYFFLNLTALSIPTKNFLVFEKPRPQHHLRRRTDVLKFFGGPCLSDASWSAIPQIPSARFN